MASGKNTGDSIANKATVHFSLVNGLTGGDTKRQQVVELLDGCPRKEIMFPAPGR